MRDEVGDELLVVVADWVLSLDGREEVAGNEFRSLVDELVERMLTVRAGLAPDDRTGGVIDALVVDVDALAVALHIALLQVGGEPTKILVVGEYRDGFGVPEVVVPDSEERHDDRNIFTERRRAEIFVDFMGAGKKLFEILESDRKRDTQTNRAPKGITSADPVPEFEHVLRIYAKLFDGVAVCRKRDEMLRDRLFVLRGAEEPRLGGFRVCHRFLRRERFRRDDKERRFRIELFERFGDMSSVDVGNEVGRNIRLIGRQRFADHARTEIGTSDSDVDDVGNRFARIPFPFSASYATREILHFGEDSIYVGHNVFSVDEDRRVAAIAKRGVEHGATFGDVDLFPREHRFDFFLEPRFFGESDKQIDRFFCRAVFGEVVENPSVFDRKFIKSLRIVREQLAHRDRFDFLLMSFKILPRGGLR